MRIVLIVDWHSEKMGYSDNFLPKALSALGHEVHLVTSNGQVYFNSSDYKDVFGDLLGPGVVDCEVKQCDGYMLHRLPFMNLRGRIRMRGLIKKLHSLQPDIVQAGDPISLYTYEVALARLFLGYKFFVECHIHASVFGPLNRKGTIKERLYWLFYPFTIGKLMNFLSEKHYPISTDAAEITSKFLGIKKNKITVRSLGVDTALFRPATDEVSQQARLRLREQLGFCPSDTVCIYAGRITQGKNPLCLAKAIGKLVREGQAFRGLFIGNGPKEEVGNILSHPGCVVHPLVPNLELPRFYWAADIAVWPRQESTSQLDAASCGLPLILSNRVKVTERIEGNGLVYEEDDPDDLACQIKALAEPQIRRQMGEYGAKKMRKSLDWNEIAKEYILDYELSLQRKKKQCFF